MDNGEEVDAFAYIMHDEDDFKPGFPSLVYYNAVKQGYKDFGFDQSLLEEALDESTKQQRPFGFPMTAEEALRSCELCQESDDAMNRKKGEGGEE